MGAEIIIGIIAAVVAAAAGIWGTSATNKAKTEQSQLAYKREQEMTDKMNYYNSPAQQMQRFRDAQLNPNLIYGQASSGNQSVLPKYNAPDIDWRGATDRVDPINEMNKYKDLGIKEASIEESGSRKKLNNARVITEGYKQGILEKEDARLLMQNEILEQTKGSQVAEKVMNAQAKKLYNELTEQKKKEVNQRIKNLEEDYKYKKFISRLSEEGMTVGDNFWMRFLYLMKGSSILENFNHFRNEGEWPSPYQNN